MSGIVYIRENECCSCVWNVRSAPSYVKRSESWIEMMSENTKLCDLCNTMIYSWKNKCQRIILVESYHQSDCVSVTSNNHVPTYKKV